MPTRCEIWAPAKLNLGLRVVGRRNDGYHDLETLFVAIDLYDHLTFTKRIAGGVSLEARSSWDGRTPAGFPLGEQNLIVRAIRLIEQDCGIHASLSISIEKSIPIAAGLGGGSSDAAAALVAMARLYGLDLPHEHLTAWARQLGADVSFFLGTPIAEGWGRGDSLRPARLFSDWWAVLVSPPVFLSAKEVYGGLDLTSKARRVNFTNCRDREGFLAALRRIQNDLEPVVIRLAPEISLWQGRLREQGAAGVFVSGSGPTVFGVFMDQPPDQAVQCLRESGTGARVLVARPVGTPTALVVR
jgi:4-diphosphocytidyl-2-C-methyl-D-erythritol kinase